MGIAVERDIAPIMSNDTEFRALCQQIHDDLIAAGWVDNGDTGQLTIASATKPGAANTAAGYRVYKMADSLATGSSKNCVLKIEFGTGASGATAFGLWLTCALATNGAGSVTGNASTRRQICCNGTSASTEKCIASGSTNRYGLCYFFNVSGSRMFGFSVERTHNNDGTDNNMGILFAVWNQTEWGSGNSNIKYYYIPYSGSVVSYAKAAVLMTTNTNSGVVDTDTYLYPFFFEDRGRFLRSLNLHAYWDTNFSATTKPTVPVWDGSNHVFYCVGLLGGRSSQLDLANSCFAFRWET